MNSVTLPADDRLLLFGYGLFETVLVTAEGPRLLRAHWQRMQDGAKVLNLSLPDFSDWLEQIDHFLLAIPLKPPYALRLTLSGGSPAQNHPPRLLLQSRPFSYTASQYENGIRVYLLPSPHNEHSPLTRIKSTNYLENLLAKEEAVNNNAAEGLWFNCQGFLAEGTMSNIFFVCKQTLCTPSLACGCLPGTRRALILRLAAQLQIPVIEGTFTRDDLLLAEEVFLSNALMGIMPVQRINNHSFQVAPSSHPASLTRILEREFSQLIGNTP
ncbi:MAG TPA: aminotransferase class IV [Desulfitobacteriaceae bacterium]|nr:aminotransferase class IV [Desulfitobacteriaceae bacterium]